MSFLAKRRYSSLSSAGNLRRVLEHIISQMRRENDLGYCNLPDDYVLPTETLLASYDLNTAPPSRFKFTHIKDDSKRTEVFRVFEATCSTLLAELENIGSHVAGSRILDDAYNSSPEKRKEDFHKSVSAIIEKMKNSVRDLEKEHGWMLTGDPKNVLAGGGANEQIQDRNITKLNKYRQDVATVGIIADLFEKVREKDGIVIQG